MKKTFIVTSAAVLVAAGMACSQNAASPSGAKTGSEAASSSATTASSADGSSRVVTDDLSGVSLSAPTPSSPADGNTFKYVEQPLTLVVKNAVTTGAAPTYTFQVAGDAAFGSLVNNQEGVAQGANGTTSVVLPKLAGGKTYFWRARATSSGTVGLFSVTRSFNVRPEVILQAPVLADPGSGATVGESPTLVVNNSARTGPAERVSYRFDISDSSSFGTILYTVTVPERTDQPVTSHTVTVKLAERTYWWRAMASDPANGVVSPYSVASTFKVAKGLDLRTAHIVMGPQNIADWPETSEITDAYETGDLLCIFHTRLGNWPTTGFLGDPNVPVEGNQWVFALIDGVWHGGAADWYRPGQACKGVNANSIARDAFYLFPGEPISHWVPQSGEVFGVMSTTPARLWPGMATVDERTDVKLITWP